MNEPEDITVAKIQAATQLTTTKGWAGSHVQARELFSAFYRAISEAVRDGDDPPPMMS